MVSITLEPKPATCALSVSPSTVPFGGTTTFRLSLSGVDSTTGLSAYWNGTKNGTSDAVNAPAGGTVPGSWAVTNSAGLAGTYVRSLKVLNAQGSTVCTSNPVSVTFAPSAPVTCSLSVSPTTVPVGGQYRFTVGVSGATGTLGYWYGSKNGVTDATNAYLGAVPGTFTYTNPGGIAGTYARQIVVRNSGGTTLCTTPSRTVTLQ